MAVIVRPATRADIAAFSDMANKPTVKAWVGDLDGRIIAIGGLFLVRGRWFAFLDLTEEARPYKMTLMRWAHRMLAEARKNGIRFIYAEASPREARSREWLARLGFEPDVRSGYLYRWSA